MEENIENNALGGYKYWLKVLVIGVVCFVASFLITSIILNNDSYKENTVLYALDKVEAKGDNNYEITYFNPKDDEESREFIVETTNIDEFLETESDTITKSYFKEIEKIDNSFLNSMFHFNDNVIKEKKYYISPFDKLLLEEYGTTETEEPETDLNQSNNS